MIAEAATIRPNPTRTATPDSGSVCHGRPVFEAPSYSVRSSLRRMVCSPPRVVVCVAGECRTSETAYRDARCVTGTPGVCRGAGMRGASRGVSVACPSGYRSGYRSACPSGYRSCVSVACRSAYRLLGVLADTIGEVFVSG